ncbi:MAG: hypothetical protein QOH47_2443 [Sphingomonadales bacterium]|nr:hypothetical protein [Sphingomonadales bacterium]
MSKQWTPADDAAAAREGWGVFEVGGEVDLDGQFEIQRDDEAGTFGDDEAALAHVRERAKQGSGLHRRALVRTVTV